MSDLKPKIRAALNTFLQAHEGHHLKADVLRIIEEEALLMKQTELVKDELSRDPMGQLGEIEAHIERLKNALKVTSYDKVRALDGYTRIDAVITIGTAPPNLLQLTFRYEQKRREEAAGCHIRYSIELSKNYLQRENLVVVEVWAPKNGPSPGTAVCINQAMNQMMVNGSDDDEDGWEDIDEEEAEGGGEPAKAQAMDTTDDSQTSKRQKLNEESQQQLPNNRQQGPEDGDDKSEQTHDEFIAYLDPDLLHEFLAATGLTAVPMDEGKAFFLLMTFPFYEHEFDLVGYLLDEIFGSEDSDDEDSSES